MTQQRDDLIRQRDELNVQLGRAYELVQRDREQHAIDQAKRCDLIQADIVKLRELIEAEQAKTQSMETLLAQLVQLIAKLVPSVTSDGAAEAPAGWARSEALAGASTPSSAVQNEMEQPVVRQLLQAADNIDFVPSDPADWSAARRWESWDRHRRDDHTYDPAGEQKWSYRDW